ncbi:hypothetical protein MAR_006597, partial [Mya arenaria]
INRYWKPITLRFDDGTEASFEVDLPTWKAVVEDKDQSMIEKLVKNNEEAMIGKEGAIPDQTVTQQPSTDQLVPSAEDKDSNDFFHFSIFI